MAIDVTKMIEPAKELAQPVAATLSDTWAAVIGDRVAAWRLKNAAALQLKVNEEVGKLGLQFDRSKIPERYAFSWFEEATKQDEPEIQELFARLLARAAAGDEDALDRRHLELLSRFTPMEAKLLHRMPDLELKAPAYSVPFGIALYRALKADEGEERTTMAFEHLTTLGIFERYYSLKHGEHYQPDQYSVEEETALSATGRSLCRALAIIPG
jgi:hypothetical protein